MVARRARTENFPVASLLFPRRLRPHLRAVYGFARLVDILGDELSGGLTSKGEFELDWPCLEAIRRSTVPIGFAERVPGGFPKRAERIAVGIPG